MKLVGMQFIRLANYRKIGPILAINNSEVDNKYAIKTIN